MKLYYVINLEILYSYSRYLSIQLSLETKTVFVSLIKKFICTYFEGAQVRSP
jgi:hypothetical protein